MRRALQASATATVTQAFPHSHAQIGSLTLPPLHRIKHREISALIKELGQDVVEQRIVDAQDTPIQPQFQLVSRIIVRCPSPAA